MNSLTEPSFGGRCHRRDGAARRPDGAGRDRHVPVDRVLLPVSSVALTPRVWAVTDDLASEPVEVGTRHSVLSFATHAANLSSERSWIRLADDLSRFGLSSVPAALRDRLSGSVDVVVDRLGDDEGMGGAIFSGPRFTGDERPVACWAGLRNEMLLWADHLAVIGRPGGRLLVIETRQQVEADDIVAVEFEPGRAVMVESNGSVHTISGASAQHLAALAPGATSVTVDVIPRTVVWSEVVAGLDLGLLRSPARTAVRLQVADAPSGLRRPA